MVGSSGAALERSSPPTATARSLPVFTCCQAEPMLANISGTDRKSTRLNSSHQIISYAVFCLKKKNYKIQQPNHDDMYPVLASVRLLFFSVPPVARQA